jgi:hypothetical protein
MTGDDWDDQLEGMDAAAYQVEVENLQKFIDDQEKLIENLKRARDRIDESIEKLENLLAVTKGLKA